LLPLFAEERWTIRVILAVLGCVVIDGVVAWAIWKLASIFVAH